MDSNLVMIANGPSKFDLMLAVFDSKFPDFRTVVFHLRDERKFEANVTGVQAEDGSGESWNFTASGHLSSDEANKFVHIDGYYRTDRREGHIKFPDNKSNGATPTNLGPVFEYLEEARESAKGCQSGMYGDAPAHGPREWDDEIWRLSLAISDLQRGENASTLAYLYDDLRNTRNARDITKGNPQFRGSSRGESPFPSSDEIITRIESLIRLLA